jgi:hypothetical protein
VCEQSIRDRAGKVWTGRLTDHLGNGLAEIDVNGKRHVGRKITLGQEAHSIAVHFNELCAEIDWANVQH